MSHRAGLVREPPVGHYFDDTAPTLAATVDSLNRTTLVYAPGTRTKYSNAGIAVVGRVLEVVAKQPFADALRDRVLEPLGLQEERVRADARGDEAIWRRRSCGRITARGSTRRRFSSAWRRRAACIRR